MGIVNLLSNDIPRWNTFLAQLFNGIMILNHGHLHLFPSSGFSRSLETLDQPLQPCFLVQFLHQIRESLSAFHDPIRAVDRDVETMIRDTTLWKVVGPNPMTPITCRTRTAEGCIDFRKYQFNT